MSKFVKVFLIIIVFIYLICLYKYINAPIISDVVKYGKLEESFNTDCYVIKNEEYVYSNFKGEYVEIAKEGQRVPKNAHIITAFKDTYNESVLQKIEDIDSKISSIRNNVNNNSIFSSDLQKIDNQIEKKIELIKNRIDNKDYGSIKNIKEDINKLIEKKIIISGKDSVGVYNLSDLIDEKEEYEKIIADNQINVKSDISGIVSYHIDGYEQFLKPENIGSFTLDEFKRLDNLELDENISSTSGQAVAKIIDNFEWYIGFVEDAELLYNIREGNFIDVRFTGIDDEIIKGEVLRVSENENDEKLVIVKFNNYIDSFYNIRKENIDVIVKTYSGYKIPTSAIRMINNKIGIFVTRDSVARFCEVEILSKNNDFAIIKENENGDTDGVLLYDEIIIKGKDIYDGKLIR